MRKKLILVAEPPKRTVIGLPSYLVDHRDDSFRAAYLRYPLLEVEVFVHRH